MSVQLQVPTIVCSGCGETLTRAIQGVDPNATVTVDLERKVVTVETAAIPEALVRAIASVGHSVAAA